MLPSTTISKQADSNLQTTEISNDLSKKVINQHDSTVHDIEGRKSQISKAMSWYCLSADKNDAQVQNSIGLMYEIGRGVPIDYHTALEWYLKAAKQNNKMACSNIGNLFLQGKGVPVDKYKALEWIRKDDSKVAKIKTLTDQGICIIRKDQKKSIQQLVKETEEIINIELKVENKSLRHSTITMEAQLNSQKQKILLLEKDMKMMQNESQNDIKNKQDTIQELERENKSLRDLSIQERQSVINEMQLLKISNSNMEQQLETLKKENQSLRSIAKHNSQENNKILTTLESLLVSKTNEMKLLQQNIDYVMKSENKKKRKLEKENKRLRKEIKKEKNHKEDNKERNHDLQDEAVDINSVSSSNNSCRSIISMDEGENKRRKVD